GAGLRSDAPTATARQLASICACGQPRIAEALRYPPAMYSRRHCSNAFNSAGPFAGVADAEHLQPRSAGLTGGRSREDECGSVTALIDTCSEPDAPTPNAAGSAPASVRGPL